MKLRLSNITSVKILILLAFGWLMNFSLSFEFQPSYTVLLKTSESIVEKSSYFQNAILPASECNITLSPFGFQQTSAKDTNSNQYAALSSQSQTATKYTRYIHLFVIFGQTDHPVPI